MVAQMPRREGFTGLHVTHVNIAVIGLGKIAQDRHLPAIAASSVFKLVATVDPGDRFIPGVAHFKTCEDLLLHVRERLDAVVLATPPQVRFRLAKLCLCAGVHVLLEKPPTTTPEELAALCGIASGKSVTLFAAWHARFNPSIDVVRGRLEGTTVVKFEATWHEDWHLWHPGQAWIWQLGGLGVFDAGINALSILTLLCPRRLSVKDASLTFLPGKAMPVKAFLAMDDGDGWSGHVSLDWGAQSQVWDITLEPSRGERVTLRRGGSDLLIAGKEIAGDPMLEYPRIYERFAELITEGASEADPEPLRIALEALKFGARIVEPD